MANYKITGEVAHNTKGLFVPIMCMIAATNFTAMMNTTAVTILLPVFMKQFSADIILAQWVVTAYILATCIIAPTVGYISDQLGLKRAFLFAIIGFSVTTLCLGIANQIYFFIALRALQGLFGGMLMPLTQSMIYQLFPRQKQSKAVSIWATTNLLAPTVAPSLAGIISDIWGWRWIFILEIPILLIVLLAAIQLIPNRHDVKRVEGQTFDNKGLLLSVVGSICLLIAFSNITTWGLYSVPVILLTALGGCTLIVFFYIEKHQTAPLLHVDVFRYEGYGSSVVLLCIGSILINISNNIMPIFLQEVKNLTTTQTALVMLPAPLVIMVLVPLMGKYYERIGPRPMLYAIMTFGVFACMALGSIGIDTAIPAIIFALILRDIGAGTLNMPATNMGMQAVPTAYVTHAAAMTSWVRQCVISLAVGLANTFQTARTNHYQSAFDGAEIAVNHCISYTAAMNDLFHLLTIAFILGYVAIYFSKSRKKRTCIENTLAK